MKFIGVRRKNEVTYINIEKIIMVASASQHMRLDGCKSRVVVHDPIGELWCDATVEDLLGKIDKMTTPMMQLKEDGTLRRL